MLKPKATLKLALLLVAWIAVGPVSSAIAAADQAARVSPVEQQKAREEYDRAEKALMALEESFTEQRLKARLALVDKEEALRIAQRDESARREKDLAELKRLQRTLEVRAPSPANAPEIARDAAKMEVVERRLAAHDEKLLRLRKDIVSAEEHLRFLDRRQAIQRHRAQAELDAAERRLAGAPGAPVTSESNKRRLTELEEKTDRLLREMTELRRDLRRRPSEP